MKKSTLNSGSCRLTWGGICFRKATCTLAFAYDPHPLLPAVKSDTSLPQSFVGYFKQRWRTNLSVIS